MTHRAWHHPERQRKQFDSFACSEMADQTNVSGSVLDDLLRANKSQKKELTDALKQSGTPTTMGVLAAQHLLEWMQENIPCLSLQQRVGLVSGHACRTSQSIEAQELRRASQLVVQGRGSRCCERNHGDLD